MVNCLHILLAVTGLMAQKDSAEFVNTESKETYDQLFLKFDTPCYNSSKVRGLIPDSGNKYRPGKINDSAFENLSAFEHFVYAFNHPEWYYQSCSLFPQPDRILQKIPAHLKRQGEGVKMSRRQTKAITSHRDSTIILLKTCIEKRGWVSDNFKRVILKLKAFELIPTLIEVSRQSEVKDPYILSLLCLLMRFDYEPFVNSDIHKQFYAGEMTDEYFFSGAKYKNNIPFTVENYKRIIDWAKGYYEYQLKAPSKFVKIPAGNYSLGEKAHEINPFRTVEVKGFEISRYEITNKQFNVFVKNTGYVTKAEEYKDAFVFRLGLDEFEWIQDSTANWRYPNGVSQGGIDDKMDHPVTCISYYDAMAYCSWAGVRLPTIDEWEVASRGGTTNTRHYFGDSLALIYEHANVWHGKTHLMKYPGEDYLTTSPVGQYEPNPFEIYDIYGNVFEFCVNTPKAFKDYDGVAATRGGSWWCSNYACGFFNSVDIGRVKLEASFSNNGFRVVR